MLSKSKSQILSYIYSQPNHCWMRTQRELANELNYSAPELSVLVNQLITEKKLRKGPRLIGVRGRSFSLEFIQTQERINTPPNLVKQLKTLREELSYERALKNKLVADKEKLVFEKENLTQMLGQKDLEIREIRGELNDTLLMVRKQSGPKFKRSNHGTFKVREVLDDNDRQLLDMLMQQPNHQLL